MGLLNKAVALASLSLLCLPSLAQSMQGAYRQNRADVSKCDQLYYVPTKESRSQASIYCVNNRNGSLVLLGCLVYVNALPSCGTRGYVGNPFFDDYKFLRQYVLEGRELVRYTCNVERQNPCDPARISRLVLGQRSDNPKEVASMNRLLRMADN